MLAALGTRGREAAAAFASNFRVRDLRRTQLSFAGAWTSEWMLTVGLAIVAFDDGGAAAVGAVALLRLLPGAIAGPFLATLADRFRRERVIAAIGLIRAGSVGIAALVLMAGAAAWPVYALAVVATIAGTPFRAAHSALLPSLCMTPAQLTSANAVRGMLDSVSTLVGPAAAAVLLEVSTPAAVFGAAAAASLWSGLLVVRLRYEAPPRRPTREARGVLAATATGMRTLARERDLAILFAMATSQTFTRGCLNVLIVVVAIDLMDLGESGVGVLGAAVGAGAVLGSIGATLLSSSRRLAIWYGVSIVLWGLPLVVIGVVPEPVMTLVMLATIGVANALLDVAGFSLFARLAPDEVLGRVFGVFEALVALSMGLGSILTPLVIAGLGARGALVAIGSVAPIVALLAWRRLTSVDTTMITRDRELAFLRGVGMLKPLPMPVMEHLARQTAHRAAHLGEVICAQGDVGDRFYVVARGEVDVLDGDCRIAVLGKGEAFGEIALLHDVPRTTTVRARGELELIALDRDVFVPAVTGYSASATAAEERIGQMLGLAGMRRQGVAL